MCQIMKELLWESYLFHYRHVFCIRFIFSEIIKNWIIPFIFSIKCDDLLYNDRFSYLIMNTLGLHS